MTHFPTDVDPEVRAILNEVIADPRSVLLRAPDASCATLLGFREQRASVSSSFLSSAEKHLLERHREEAGQLLHQAAMIKLRSPGLLDSRIHSSRVVDTPWFNRRVRQWLERGRPQGAHEVVDLLHLAAHSTRVGPSMSAFALAALRLVPSDHARITLALTLNAEGRQEEARAWLFDVLKHKPSAPIESVCHGNLGFFHGLNKEFDGALSSYRRACATGETASWVHASWLVFALRDGNQREILTAARQLDQSASPGRQEDEALAMLKADVTNSNWWPTRDSQRVVPAVVSRLPERAQSFALAVAEPAPCRTNAQLGTGNTAEVLFASSFRSA